MLKLLHSFGCDLEALDKEKATPLLYASERNHLEIVKYLD